RPPAHAVALWVGLRTDLSFFFSSRRRHTRFSRDWSSDVCSSDLDQPRDQYLPGADGGEDRPEQHEEEERLDHAEDHPGLLAERRSEERRVGKEGRCRWAAEHEQRQTSTERRPQCADGSRAVDTAP